MEHMTIELRQRIQSCNVFILLDKSSDNQHIQLRLRNTSILVNISNLKFNIDLPNITIIPETLSSLNVAGTWITFRVQTKPSDSTFGTLKTEFLTIDSNDNKTILKYNKPLKCTKIIIACQCCKNVLTKSDIEFKRILPLPSDDCDPCEWFCGCNHSHNNDDKIDLSNVKMLLAPREHDYLYGSHYCLLSNKIFLDKMKYNEQDVVCNRCLSVLGVQSPDIPNSIKFWNHSLEYLSSTDNDYNIKTTPIDDFKSALISCINNEYKQIIFIANEHNNKSILFVKLLEKNLTILIEESTRNILKNIQAIKIMYKHDNIEMKNIDNKNSNDIITCKISLKSFNAAIEHLISTSCRIPPIYRLLDDYHIGYVI
ncbi:uncharacterized protein LOC122858137 [Aphidius gifuensis]|uniref:uncharacterized protein LOC122858137 n=1 Tax=Aphidius gifuensis TaxID=684658 RepID=UPI001CDB9F57|nr:uncharacterized protein LOC122858137 [Aphidius gifuensis]